MPLNYLMFLVVLLTGIIAFAENPTPVVREEHKLVVDGVEEHWRLEWARPPVPVCSPDEPDVWSTCPCSGFAFGERGNLILVRTRPGQKEERLELGPLFGGKYDLPGNEGEAILRRWDEEERDMEASKLPDFAARVRARPIAQAIRLGDYNHDGQATEFLLQVGNLPCGKKMNVAIGVSRRNPRLHVFGSTEHPERPLVLQVGQWEALLQAKGPVKVMDWKCGDHGSDTETELELSADGTGILAKRWEYQCKQDGSRGKLIKKEGI